MNLIPFPESIWNNPHLKTSPSLNSYTLPFYLSPVSPNVHGFLRSHYPPVRVCKLPRTISHYRVNSSNRFCLFASPAVYNRLCPEAIFRDAPLFSFVMRFGLKVPDGYLGLKNGRCRFLRTKRWKNCNYVHIFNFIKSKNSSTFKIFKKD